MELTLEVLQKHGACSEGVKWYKENDCPKTATATVNLLLASSNENKLNWSNWLIARMLSRNNKIRYAIYAAEQVIGIYKKKYPDDKRPRKAIQAAKAYLKNPTLKNKNAANAAAYAAYAAYAAADAAYAAANAAAYAAAYAAYAAADAANAAYAAADAAYAAANAAAYAAANEMKLKIIRYGLGLIK
jgi:hypothetical protein